ncbi:site-specific DNA-methyltransferase [Bradyrhizobium tropiciagri]|uniref:DNA-methyltransferase n=1 Tax=Bradyrhizobium tropiciagri TaxID=312253 RepID=UPI001BA6A9CC|nr:site-specific DNA-methyltransferase [Bradyrhizobium tropiciagri]MBR0896815.1 site-specific DNA-methyltransferase [Bradyrhizobium tropiciagri]
MSGKAFKIDNDSKGFRRSRAEKPAAKPRLKELDGDEQAEFKLIDPNSLLNPSYGYFQGKSPWLISNDDALAGVKRLPDDFVDCTVTSPPYYWQRDYGVDGQTGQEDTLEEYVAAIAAVFREIRRVLKPSGTAFLVLGDTYYSGKGQPKGGDPKQLWRGVARQKYRAVDKPGFGLPKKSMLGVPWRVALALQADGWIIRSAVVWKKPKPMAEPSVRDRPWTTTETVFILSKTGKYHFNRKGLGGQEDVWEIPAATSGRRYRHAAPYPEALVERCLAAGCPRGGVVLDPYAGSGTTLVAAAKRKLPSIGFELNPRYWTLARQRLITKPVERRRR